MGLRADFEFIDLFAGCGGATSGAVEACRERGLTMDGVAVNHNQRAIETHWANFPWMRHERQDIRALEPLKVVPSGHRDFIIAAPECRAYSSARGNKPWKPQFRTSPREILRFMRALNAPDALIENVPDFLDWGPNDENGDPVEAFTGIFFKRFMDAIRDLGYAVDWRVLTAADYGDATTRQRLFIQCRRGLPISWPEPTHTPDLWRPAREIIDWTLKGESIFNRRKPLAENTLNRILVGLEKFCKEELKPFLVMFYGTNDVRSLLKPLPTITAKGQHIGLVDFVLPQHSGGAPRLVDQPLPTIATRGAISLIRTFLVKYYGSGTAVSVDEPLDTITTKDRFGKVDVLAGERWGIDITLRMLAPHELAAAMSFRPDYIFSGTHTDQIQQIGNAWPVKTGKAIFGHMIDTRLRSRRAA